MLVVPSRAEGGASVLSEAAVRGLAILATRVPGNAGVLGARHPGLFAPGDARALARLLLRCEQDSRFLARLRAASLRLAPALAPSAERAAWAALLRGLDRPARPVSRRRTP